MQLPRKLTPTWRSILHHCLSLLFFILVIMAFQTAPAYATGVWELPTPTEAEPLLVLDEGAVLSRATQGTITQASQKLAKQKDFNVHIVTVHRLDYGDTAESLAQQILTEWYPEADQRANQAILVVDTVTNTGGLKVGENLKVNLPDAVATSIIQENLAQPLRQNRYNQALQDASDRLTTILAGLPDPGPPKAIVDTRNVEGTFATAEETAESRVSSTVWVVLFLVAATVIPMATYYFYLFLQSQD